MAATATPQGTVTAAAAAGNTACGVLSKIWQYAIHPVDKFIVCPIKCYACGKRFYRNLEQAKAHYAQHTVKNIVLTREEKREAEESTILALHTNSVPKIGEWESASLSRNKMRWGAFQPLTSFIECSCVRPLFLRMASCVEHYAFEQIWRANVAFLIGILSLLFDCTTCTIHTILYNPFPSFPRCFFVLIQDSRSKIKMASSNVYKFHVEMTCEGCSGAVKRVLGKLEDKVSRVDIDLEGKRVEVESTLSRDEILETLKKTGKAVSVIE